MKGSVDCMKLKKELYAWILMIPALFVLYFMIWRPQILGIIWSFFKMEGYTPVSFLALKNYIDVVTDSDFLRILLNTCQYVIWSMIIGFIPPIIIAIILNEMKYGKGFFKVSLYLPTMLPTIAVMLMWYFVYYPDGSGLLNIFLGKFGIEPRLWLNDSNMVIPLIIISMTWKSMGSAMLLYFCALQSVNIELYEAAIIDGAGLMKRVRYVTLPQISGIIILNFVNQIIAVFQVMEQPMAMTGGGPNGASMSLGYQLYQYGFVSGRIGQALALGGIMFIFLILSTCFYFYLNRKVEQNLG